MEGKAPLELRFSHNIIEHLGLKLYQNKPTNVLAELVSNAWDADATKVYISESQENEQRIISIGDNGHGMTYDELLHDYLIIGKPKRQADEIHSREKNRKLMGRKGIGKLAPFGIANLITIFTAAKDSASEKVLVNIFTLDLKKIYEAGQQATIEGGVYQTEQHVFDKGIDELSGDSLPYKDQFKKFKGLIDKDKGTGTLIVLDNLTGTRSLSSNQLRNSIGRRFTVTLLRDDFNVYVNGNLVDKENSLPEFDFRIPDSGTISKDIQVAGESQTISYWVGFVKEASWPQDEAGVGVYAHGKIAQDRPFFFRAKGREIYTRYMYGVIEADWLDELPTDVISTDRTNINWEDEHAEPLLEEGQALVRNWIRKYRRWCEEELSEDITKKLKDNRDLPRVSPGEEKAIVEMVSNMGGKVVKDEEFQNQVLTAVTSAWTHKPMRPLIKQLWDVVSSPGSDDDAFLNAMGELNGYMVPESLSIGVVLAQRVYALTKLGTLIDGGNETQLQILIERYPWIISPDMEKLTANQKLKTAVTEAAKRGEVPCHGEQKEKMQNDENLKPDFVFFTNAEKTKIVAVEMKGPDVPLNIDHREQLHAYMNYIERHYRESDREGILIGNCDGDLDVDNARMRKVSWNQLYQRSRKEHVELISAILMDSSSLQGEGGIDARIEDMFNFGGEELNEFVRNMAEKNEELREILEDIDSRLARSNP